MTACRLSRRARRAAALVAAVVLAWTGAGTTALAQQPGTSYSQRAGIFDPRGQRIGNGSRTVPPVVRQRPTTHRSYFADQRSGTYENRSLPSVRNSAPSRAGGAGAVSAMSRMSAGMGGPGMNAATVLNGQRGGGRVGGTYGGARPR